MEEEDLWGELPVNEKIETPLAVLRTQSDLLRVKTSGQLVGRVITNSDSNGNFSHELRIVAPALGNYSTSILWLSHSPLLYPASISNDGSGWTEVGKAMDGESLRKLIGRVLSSATVHKTIVALLAQVRDANSERARVALFEGDDTPF